MGLVILLGAFALGIAAGMPVAFAMGIAAASAFLFEGFPMLITFQRAMAGVTVFSLLAIPFFVLAGEIMLHGGIAKRLLGFASALVGHIKGGLAMVNIFSSMLFGGISGSAVADISALGSVQIPLMKERGYRPDFAVNVTITSSIAGIIIPPSHNMIIFAVAAGGGISISKLFLAGVIPGVLMCLCLAVAAYVLSLKHQYPAEPFPGVAALGRSSLQALPGLFTAVIIIGGTLSGVFTVTESGAFGAIYALLLTTLHYRSLSWQGFRTAVASSVRTTAMVMILIAFASSFAYLLALYQVPSKLSDLLLAISDNPIVVLLMINVILLLLGMIMDMAALILICTPIFLPIAKSLGMAPEHFGIMLLVNLGIGLCTPPVGTCLFIGCAVGKVKIEDALRTIWPFYLAILFALILVTYFPVFTMWLPDLMS
ncbi:MAG: TRAP transporter large permease [Rhodocyclaceae bacterium]|nr:TRAP transporter large permease [Rhodocyclaceae bacterium]MCP5232356.1 TRAP transporter large permease [Zoogloeaceae bacterium]MCB1911025.1 TRAP transporter large permease [Rhodocyclaceae bacterium]MCP5241126.1 TRAP transporter large permease [Zoogloeaceae bacterium]MCP5254930.1 TRAP transporter large permease [Zoogloeaceae bacterium]